jgi:hypothetical protein
MNKGNDNSSKSRKNPSKPPFSQFLKESGIKNLEFLGKCMQYWGVKPALIFIFGAVFIWALALFFPLPGYNVFSEQNGNKQKDILIHGNVKIEKEGGLEDYEEPFLIGVFVGDLHGPLNDNVQADGSFSVEVPFKRKYNIVIWDSKFSHFIKYFGDRTVKQIDNDYCFYPDLEILK